MTSIQEFITVRKNELEERGKDEKCNLEEETTFVTVRKFSFLLLLLKGSVTVIIFVNFMHCFMHFYFKFTDR